MIDFHTYASSETQQIHRKEYEVKNGTHKDTLICFAFSFGREYACFLKIQQWNKDKNTASLFKNTHNCYYSNTMQICWLAAGDRASPNLQFSHTSFKCMFLVPQAEFFWKLYLKFLVKYSLIMKSFLFTRYRTLCPLKHSEL